MTITRPQHVNPLQWNEAVAQARQGCARVFRSGGAPMDALVSFGLAGDHALVANLGSDWSRAVDVIAQGLCSSFRRAA